MLWTVLFSLLISMDHATARLVDRLGSPKFSDRQRADAELRANLTWLGVLRLERASASLNCEGRMRVSRIIEAYWARQFPPVEQLAYIDALNGRNPCNGPNTALVTAYLTRAGNVCLPGVRYSNYRAATWLLLRDLRCLPPCLTRALLNVMRQRSEQWERKQGQTFP